MVAQMVKSTPIEMAYQNGDIETGNNTLTSQEQAYGTERAAGNSVDL